MNFCYNINALEAFHIFDPEENVDLLSQSDS